MSYSSNPVPRGVSNSGDAVVLGGDGLGALRMLERQDAMAAKLRERAAAAAQKEKDASFRDFASKLNLSDEAGVHFIPEVGAHAQEAHQQMLALTEDPTLDRQKRALQQQEIADSHARFAKASVRIDDALRQYGSKVTTDKRYDGEKSLAKIYDTLYAKNEDGTPQVNADGSPKKVLPTAYDPKAAEAAISVGHEHLNGVEVFKTYLRGSHPDAVTYEKQALPGGKGFRNVASSDVYEIGHDGKITYDPHTNLPVVKATPQALQYFDSDPVSRQYLDGFEQQHQKSLASAVEKMQNLQQLTPEESEAVRVEQSPAGRRMELFKRGLLEQGYGRQQTDLLAKAAARPLRTPTAKAPTNVVSVSNEGVPSSVLGGTTRQGGSGFLTYGTLGAALYGKPGQEQKKYSSKGAKFQEVITLGDNGQPGQVDTDNQATGDIEIGQRHLLLRAPNGGIFSPPQQAVEAAKRGDLGPANAYAQRERLLHPGLKHEWYVEVGGLGNKGTEYGSEESVFQHLKDARASQTKAAAGSTLTPEEKHNNELLASTMAAVNQGKSSVGGPAELTDDQLHEMASKVYRSQNKTHYVRYSGADKILLDQATSYSFRHPASKGAMDKMLADAEQRTRPRPGTTDPATGQRPAWLPTKTPATRSSQQTKIAPAVDKSGGML